MYIVNTQPYIYSVHVHQHPLTSDLKTFFLCFKQNICCGYSQELSLWDVSFERPKHLKLIGKEIVKKNTLKKLVIWTFETFWNMRNLFYEQYYKKHIHSIQYQQYCRLVWVSTQTNQHYFWSSVRVIAILTVTCFIQISSIYLVSVAGWVGLSRIPGGNQWRQVFERKE